jgi:hypothetical protein
MNQIMCFVIRIIIHRSIAIMCYLSQFCVFYRKFALFIEVLSTISIFACGCDLVKIPQKYRKISQKSSKNIAKCLVFIAKYRKISIQAISIFCDTHLSQKNLQFRYLSLCLKNIDNVQKVSIMTKNYRKCTCNKRKTRASCMKNTSVIAIFFDNYRKFAIFIATIFSLR